MARYEQTATLTVANSDRSALQGGGVSASLRALRQTSAVMFVFLGAGLTIGWMLFLGWCLFGFVRWAVG